MVFEKIKGYIRENFNTSRIKSIKESGYGLVRPEKDSAIWQDTADHSGRQTELENYKQIYLNFPIVYSAIETKANQVVQDFWFESPDKERKKRFNRLKDKLNLSSFLQNLARTMFIYGDAFVETCKVNGTVTELKILNSEHMQVYTDKTGKEIGYGQIIKEKKLILWGTTGNFDKDKNFVKKLPASKFGFISHFKLNPIAMSKYGISMIKPIMSSVELKKSIETDLKTIVKRYIAPLIHFKVGTEERPALSGDIETVANEVEDIHARSDIVTSHLVSSEVLNFGNKGMDIKTPIEHVNTSIVSGSNVPGILIGYGSTGERDAAVQLRNFGRHVKNIQRQIKTDFEDKILKKQLRGKEGDELVWDVVDESEESNTMSNLQGLVGQGIITQQKANDLLPPRFRQKLPKLEPTQSNPNTPTPPGTPRLGQQKSDKLNGSQNPNDPTMTTKQGPGRIKKDETEAVKKFKSMVKESVI